MAERTIKAVYFGYKTEKGSFVTARRGETVDIPEGPYLTRGDKHGAFITGDEVEVEPVVDPAAPLDATPVVAEPEVVEPQAPTAFDADEILAGNVGQVVSYATDHPEHAAALLAAEQTKGEDLRKGVIDGLTKLVEGSQDPEA